MPEASRYTGWIKISLALLAMAAIIIAIARPIVPNKTGEATETTSARGIELMICLDVSIPMLASSTDDPGGVSRLRRAKFILEKLIDKLQDDKVGLIVFAGESYTQLPITSDYISAKMFVDELSTEMVPTQGTAIGAAIDMAMNSFTPDSEFDKAIVVITDGENFEDDAVGEAARAAEAGIQVDVIGLGTAGGAPIPTPKGMGHGKYLTDQNSQVVVTALNEDMAREIAKAGHGIYLQGGDPGVVGDLDAQLSTLSKSEYQRLTASPLGRASSPLWPLLPLSSSSSTLSSPTARSHGSAASTSSLKRNDVNTHTILSPLISDSPDPRRGSGHPCPATGGEWLRSLILRSPCIQPL